MFHFFCSSLLSILFSLFPIFFHLFWSFPSFCPYSLLHSRFLYPLSLSCFLFFSFFSIYFISLHFYFSFSKKLLFSLYLFPLYFIFLTGFRLYVYPLNIGFFRNHFTQIVILSLHHYPLYSTLNSTLNLFNNNPYFFYFVCLFSIIFSPLSPIFLRFDIFILFNNFSDHFSIILSEIHHLITLNSALYLAYIRPRFIITNISGLFQA